MKAELLNYFGDDLMVVNAARVSYGKVKDLFDEKDEKLIQYLVKHKHIAPFRHPQLQFRVECPIFVERQLFKHQVGLCLSGDTEISFINSSKGISKTPIKKLYETWSFGRSHQKTKKDAEYSKKRIKNKKIRVLNEDTGVFEIGKIKDIFYSGKKELFLIKLKNGKSIKCSKDHRIYTKDGWNTIKNGLRVGDLIGVNGIKVVGNGLYRNKEYLLKLRNEALSVSEMAERCECGYDNIRKWLKIHNLCFSKDERCFKTGNTPWNKNKHGYKLTISEKGLEGKRKSTPKGKKSHFWRGGITKERDLIGQWTRSVSKNVYKKYNYTCQHCGNSSGRLNAHHIIPVTQDISKAYDFDNLICVCENCHKEIHKSIESEALFAEKVLTESFKPFEYKKRIGDRSKFRTKVHFSEIISIESIGEEDAYDIEIDHKYHNFVANGIVVHNSANSISGRYVDFSDKYFKINSLRLQSKSSKQGSEGILDRPDLVDKMNKHNEISAALYKELCDAGVAKEQARIILPLALETQFIWTGSLLAFFHLWNLRLKPDTQEETRLCAAEMLKLVKEIPNNPFKHTIAAFEL